MGISKYSNEYKAYCIEKGVPSLVRLMNKQLYKDDDGEKALRWARDVAKSKELDCSVRLLESEYRKYKRARDHIESLVNNGRAVFITLTFTDAVLNKTSAATRRRYVARFLKSQSLFYVANIDYSPQKQREHYHAVVDGRVDMKKWRYGFVWVEQVRAHDFCVRRVARYVAKLTAHAFKVNASRLIYSRDIV